MHMMAVAQHPVRGTHMVDVGSIPQAVLLTAHFHEWGQVRVDLF